MKKRVGILLIICVCAVIALWSILFVQARKEVSLNNGDKIGITTGQVTTQDGTSEKNEWLAGTYGSESKCEEAEKEGCFRSTVGWVSVTSRFAEQKPPIPIKQGDVFNDLTVVSVAPFLDRGETSPPTPNNLQILFKGTTTITGTYSHVVSSIGFEGSCMTDLKNSVTGPLPIKTTGTEHYLAEDGGQLCFTNEEKAERILTPYEGDIVSVIISNYAFSVCECDAIFDRAYFVRIAGRNKKSA